MFKQYRIEAMGRVIQSCCDDDKAVADSVRKIVADLLEKESATAKVSHPVKDRYFDGKLLRESTRYHAKPGVLIRNVVTLRCAGLTYAQIGARLDISGARVGQLWNRAMVNGN